MDLFSRSRVHPEELAAPAPPSKREDTCFALQLCAIFLFFMCFLTLCVSLAILEPRGSPAEVADVGVGAASLSTFGLTDDGALLYDLSLNLTVRNPDAERAFLYDNIVVVGFYAGEVFGSDAVPMFLQPAQNTTALVTAFRGRAPLVEVSRVADQYGRDVGEGLFEIHVQLFFAKRNVDGEAVGGITQWQGEGVLKLTLADRGSKSTGSWSMNCCTKMRSFLN